MEKNCFRYSKSDTGKKIQKLLYLFKKNQQLNTMIFIVWDKETST